ncbi:unnamed protein product [Gongylonema pulchrum]|uniref:Uncharacterized protein n=1 Tax=Gongylonema pulchrum TaxID=637853 RepID=A0A183DPD6_9BILA|nr:unnamed protein product [Gongylonema pulchrum]
MSELQRRCLVDALHCCVVPKGTTAAASMVTRTTNKFINSVDAVVDDNIRGLVATHDSLATLDVGPLLPRFLSSASHAARSSIRHMAVLGSPSYHARNDLID